MKQILSLLFCCLLFAPFAYAKSKPQLTETSLPNASEITGADKNIDQSAKNAPFSLEPPAVSDSSSTPPAATPTPPKDSALSVATETSPLANYPLAPGDALNISVWKEEGMQEQEYLISPDGSIIFPLVGTVLAAGKTISELKDTLTNKLSDFISYPSVTVKLLGNQGNLIFVIGKVTKPGQYFSGRKIDVLQALSLAGGLTVYADQDSISVLRRIGNETKVFPFDYSNVIVGEDLEQNILLEPGDTVTVP